jgi:uncharacterized protein (TIGR03067 family)
MEFGIALGLAVSMLLGAGEAKNDLVSNGSALQGVWQLSSGEADGKVLSETQLKGGKAVFKDGTYTVTLANIGTVTGTQKLGATQGLQTIDIRDESGSNQGKTCLGIYELDGDEFRVVFASQGGLDRRNSKLGPRVANGCTSGSVSRNSRPHHASTQELTESAARFFSRRFALTAGLQDADAHNGGSMGCLKG